jgi:hypothetical protein
MSVREQILDSFDRRYDQSVETATIFDKVKNARMPTRDQVRKALERSKLQSLRERLIEGSVKVNLPLPYIQLVEDSTDPVLLLFPPLSDWSTARALNNYAAKKDLPQVNLTDFAKVGLYKIDRDPSSLFRRANKQWECVIADGSPRGKIAYSRYRSLAGEIDKPDLVTLSGIRGYIILALHRKLSGCPVDSTWDTSTVVNPEETTKSFERDVICEAHTSTRSFSFDCRYAMEHSLVEPGLERRPCVREMIKVVL